MARRPARQSRRARAVETTHAKFCSSAHCRFSSRSDFRPAWPTPANAHRQHPRQRFRPNKSRRQGAGPASSSHQAARRVTISHLFSDWRASQQATWGWIMKETWISLARRGSSAPLAPTSFVCLCDVTLGRARALVIRGMGRPGAPQDGGAQIECSSRARPRSPTMTMTNNKLAGRQVNRSINQPLVSMGARPGQRQVAPGPVAGPRCAPSSPTAIIDSVAPGHRWARLPAHLGAPSVRARARDEKRARSGATGTATGRRRTPKQKVLPTVGPMSTYKVARD